MSRQVEMKEMQDVQGQVPLENNEAMNSILDESFHASEMAGIITGHYLVFFFFVFFFLLSPPHTPKFVPFHRLLQAEHKRRGKVNVKYYYLKHIHRHNKALK